MGDWVAANTPPPGHAIPRDSRTASLKVPSRTSQRPEALSLDPASPQVAASAMAMSWAATDSTGPPSAPAGRPRDGGGAT